MGVSDLKRCKTDNAAGDRNLLARHFLESKKNIQPLSQVSDDRCVEIKEDKHTCITNKNVINT